MDIVSWVFGGVLALAGGITTVVGGVKAVEYVGGKVQVAKKHRAEKKNAWKVISDKMETVQNAQAAKDAKQELVLAEIQQELRSQSQTLGEIVDNNRLLTDQIGTLQSDRLNQAYDYFASKKNPLPLYQRNSLSRMYAQYTHGAKQNGVPKDFEQKMSDCPDA